MYTRPIGAGSRPLVLAVLVLGVFALPASYAQAPNPPTPKIVNFNFDHTPWRKVFTWLSDETGKPVITNNTPAGTFTYSSQPDKEYTVAEVIDIINDSFQCAGNFTQPIVLIQRERSFTLIPADEKLDPQFYQLLRDLKELHNRPRMDPVRLVFHLQWLDAEELAPVVKKLMGPAGDVEAVKGKGINELHLSDTAGNLRQVRQMLEEMDAKAKPARKPLK